MQGAITIIFVDTTDRKSDKRMMLKRLSRDYWPSEVSSPLRRLALGLLGGPAIVAPILLMIGFLADFSNSGNLQASVGNTLRFVPVLAGFSMLIMLTIGLIALLILWSLRARSRRAFALAGALIGLVACVIGLTLAGQPVRADFATLLFIASAIYFALVMLAVRWIALIRHI